MLHASPGGAAGDMAGSSPAAWLRRVLPQASPRHEAEEPEPQRVCGPSSPRQLPASRLCLLSPAAALLVARR